MNPQGWRDNFDINPDDRLFTKQKNTFSFAPYKKQGLMGLGVLVLFLILWFFFFTTPVADHELPVIKAPAGPSKIKPPVVDSQAASSHRLIYEKLGARSPNEKIEHLLKEPEEPLAAPPTLPEGFMESFVEDDEGEKESTFAENKQSQPLEAKSTKVFLDEEDDPEMPMMVKLKDSGQKSMSEVKRSTPLAAELTKKEPSTLVVGPTAPPLTVTGSSVKAVPSSVSSSQDKKVYWVQLASLKTQEATEREWKRLSSLSRLKPLLGGLKPQYGKVDMGKKEGLQFRLRVGPFTQETAKKLAHQLKGQKVESIVKKG